MHDEAAFAIEENLQAILDTRASGVTRASLRRIAANPDIVAPESSSTDTPTMAPPSAEEGASPTRAPLLVERQTTHGNFEDNAIVSQAIKDLLRAGPGWLKLSAVERESMDMIALKFSRILSGKSMEKQHWEDVVGYARLVEEKCF